MNLNPSLVKIFYYVLLLILYRPATKIIYSFVLIFYLLCFYFFWRQRVTILDLIIMNFNFINSLLTEKKTVLYPNVF